VSSQQTDSSAPPGLLEAPDAARPSRGRAADAAAIYGLLAIVAVIEYSLRDLLTKPFYTDEAWRAYDITLGAGFFSHLNESGAPLALGWLGIEDLSRLLFGNTEAALRAPMFVALPVLGIVTYLLARKWLGAAVSFCVAALLVLNPWVVNNALQLKSYSYEGILSAATIALILVVRRATLRPVQLLLLYTALGLTAVFSLPNLFLLAPLLLLDLVRAIRLRDRILLRIAGEALAGLIALVHYVLVVRPQAGVAGTSFWRGDYAPRHPGAFVHFVIHQLASFDPRMVTGVADVENQPPAYSLPPLGHDLLAAGILILLAAGVWAAVRDAAARTLVVALGGALVLELIASALQRWPFGMTRANVFMLPLFYVLGGIGAVWLARAVVGPLVRHGQPARNDQPARQDQLAWWRGPAFVAFVAGLAVTVLLGGLATAHALVQSHKAQDAVTKFSDVKAAVAEARKLAVSSDLVIVGTNRRQPFWYGEGWLYYMENYQGYPSSIARLPRIPASNTSSVFEVTPEAVRAFLAAHPHARTIFLLELELTDGLPKALHDQSVRTLRLYGYCAARRTMFYPALGDLTVLHKGACPST
jgi:4-amino-4-deoxy-L-arabinose transferase-like glycosyltransferase